MFTENKFNYFGRIEPMSDQNGSSRLLRLLTLKILTDQIYSVL